MPRANIKELLEAGVHFGHLKRKWNPKMKPYIFMEKNGIHIIDLHKTAAKIDEAANALKQIASSGKKIMFVGTKKQAQDVIRTHAESINMPYITERWLGGMLTNFPTIRRTIKKMQDLERKATDGTFNNITKKERLQISRQINKMKTVLGSIENMTKMPSALFVVDVSKEHIAVKEAKRLNIPLFAIVDTNSDPSPVDYVIPANDDATKSIAYILGIITQAIKEGIEQRKQEKEQQSTENLKKTKKKTIEIKEKNRELPEKKEIKQEIITEKTKIKTETKEEPKSQDSTITRVEDTKQEKNIKKSTVIKRKSAARKIKTR